MTHRNISIANGKRTHVAQFAQVENLHFAFGTSARQIVAVFGEANRTHLALMSREVGHVGLFANVPNFDDRVTSSSAEDQAVRVTLSTSEWRRSVVVAATAVLHDRASLVQIDQWPVSVFGERKKVIASRMQRDARDGAAVNSDNLASRVHSLGPNSNLRVGRCGNDSLLVRMQDARGDLLAMSLERGFDLNSVQIEQRQRLVNSSSQSQTILNT